MIESMIEIEIDGKKLQVPQGSMIIEAADNAEINMTDMADNEKIKIPRFCYHKKLSIAANCRMCLVEVEKAPKPLPACATPVTAGMKIFTQSAKARDAQKSVMEFLLINHPLDCPICDQGGACELQDISLMYGNDFSRYDETKRSVKDENLGSLIATDMTRCIQCTRCVRFGQEIAGVRELGTIGRGDRLQIGSFLKNHAMQSELSGNVIDLCPVGALTSKPFRFTARPWELKQAESIAAHDGLGANIYLQTHQNRVMRVVPRENEAINETWISDRDRFSYQGLYSENRLTVPMIKYNNNWQETDWATAIDAVMKKLNAVNPADMAALASPNSTLEEFYLLQKWMRDAGCQNIDHRLYETDFADQSALPLYPSLGISISEIENQKLIIIIGSHINHENPLIAHRIRKASLQGAKIICLNPVDFEFAFDIHAKLILSPSKIADLLSLLNLNNNSDHVLNNYMTQYSGQNILILLGELAVNFFNASEIRAAVRILAEKYQAKTGFITAGANSAGGWIAGAVPHRKPMGEKSFSIGLNMLDALKAKLPAYILLNIDPLLDTVYPDLFTQALKNASDVIALTAYTSPALLDCADIILPIGIFAENAGTYINLEGKWQTFKSAVPCLGEARPAWKIMRVLGNFAYMSLEEVQAEIKLLYHQKSVFHHENLNKLNKLNKSNNQNNILPEIILERPLYQTDALVRQARALQQSAANIKPCIKLNEKTALQYPQYFTSLLPFKTDNHIADNCIWIPAGFTETLEFLAFLSVNKNNG